MAAVVRPYHCARVAERGVIKKGEGGLEGMVSRKRVLLGAKTKGTIPSRLIVASTMRRVRIVVTAGMVDF